ncbi:hypothetical protein NHX12_014532 [Muraenolepis orangiensis]|uniref:NACHT domain-containing protein n=1 Tax=Muraenolepis orangiensis TaxID=630683 RepID=A0A9Q0I572_9TELE|nr:hypothetical protein NHX12_014532 [Muraenolepis orangiensis]
MCYSASISKETVSDECQHKLKSHLKKKFRRVYEGIAKAGHSTDLDDFYTELFITERESGEVNKEHEVRLIETASRKPAKEETPIKCEDIFKPLPGQDQTSRTIMTTGVAGIGKTVLTHKFTLDWAEGKVNHDIHFIFPFTFTELNLLKEKEFSLVELLHCFFIETKEAGICRNDGFQVVFILDGLDKCRFPLDFQKNQISTDVTKSTSVDVLLTNLIRGDLLPSAHIWITTRPAAANQIPAECVGMVTEVRGFTDPQKEEYFKKRFKDETQARTIISHIKTSRSLHIMWFSVLGILRAGFSVLVSCSGFPVLVYCSGFSVLRLRLKGSTVLVSCSGFSVLVSCSGFPVLVSCSGVLCSESHASGSLVLVHPASWFYVLVSLSGFICLLVSGSGSLFWFSLSGFPVLVSCIKGSLFWSPASVLSVSVSSSGSLFCLLPGSRSGLMLTGVLCFWSPAQGSLFWSMLRVLLVPAQGSTVLVSLLRVSFWSPSQGSLFWSPAQGFSVWFLPQGNRVWYPLRVTLLGSHGQGALFGLSPMRSLFWSPCSGFSVLGLCSEFLCYGLSAAQVLVLVSCSGFLFWISGIRFLFWSPPGSFT